MERVLIIGCPGAGKTSLAVALADKTGLPLVHLDRLHWRDNWQQTPIEEFDALLQVELEKPRWIIDGNFGRTMEMRLKYCDTVIYLDLPRRVCLWGALKRLVSNYGKSRPDMGGVCPEYLDKEKLEFFHSIWVFKKKSRQKIADRLSAAKHAKCIVLKSRREVKQFLAEKTVGIVVS